jgi:hypothetical protein
MFAELKMKNAKCKINSARQQHSKNWRQNADFCISIIQMSADIF